MEILNSDDMEQNLTDDQEYQQRLFIRYGIVTFKQYFHAHLGIKAQELRKRHQRDSGSTQRDSGTTQQVSLVKISISLGPKTTKNCENALSYRSEHEMYPYKNRFKNLRKTF